VYGQGRPLLSGSAKGKGTGSKYKLFKKCSASYEYCHGSFTAACKATFRSTCHFFDLHCIPFVTFEFVMRPLYQQHHPSRR